MLYVERIFSSFATGCGLFLLLAGGGVSCVSKQTPGKNVEVVYKATATTGEGSIWHSSRQSLFWVDIEGKTLYELLPATKNCRSWIFDRMVSTVVAETDSTVLVALQDEIVRVNLTTGNQEHIADVENRDGGLRCNDGKCDTEGRFWVGTMCMQAPEGSASLYCIYPDGLVVPKIDSVTISNGLVWSADKKWMYYIDTPTKKIMRYRYDAPTGDILPDGVAVSVPEGTGVPDGMAIDKDGNLWVAQWGGYGVYCYSPETGELLQKIDVPAPNVASCAFGGAKLDILYITTARAGLPDGVLQQYPLSGSVFTCIPGVEGVEAPVVKLNRN